MLGPYHLVPNAPLLDAFNALMRDLSVARILGDDPDVMLGTIVTVRGDRVEVLAEGALFAFYAVARPADEVGDTVRFRRQGGEFELLSA